MFNNAVFGYRGGKLKIIEELRPDVLVLGPDPWIKGEIEKELKKRGLRTEVVQIGEVYSENRFYGTSQVIDHIIRGYGGRRRC